MRTGGDRRRRAVAVGTGALVRASVLLLAACGGSGDGGRTDADVAADFHGLRTWPTDAGEFEMLTLSTMPDTVTGGDVLVAIRGLGTTDAFTVTRNGEDLSSSFARLPSGEVRGLVAGLEVGDNTLATTSGGRTATLVVKNHPITGPVISGPHQTPFFCRTVEAGLGPPLDEDCSVAPRFQWFYRSAVTQDFRALADPFAPYPADGLQTELQDGRVVPYVVRVESRTINRGITRIAVLDDPAARGPQASFTAAEWNRRVYYVFGESCGVGYQQGLNDPAFVLGVPDLTKLSEDRLLINVVGIDQRLGKGDVIVHSTLSAFGVHCNPLVSTETAMMVKEHVSEQYGLVEAMVGTNGSGAALQQWNLVNNAPGLLTAALPTATFADILSTAMTVSDCGLLEHYYDQSRLDWDDTKKAAVNGHNLLSGTSLNAICQSWRDAFLSRIDPSEGCDAAVPREVRYDAKTNPHGVRCTLQDANVNVFGRDPRTGFGRRPLDNVGVQYGLAALNSGAIGFGEFVDLNRKIGGFDIDGAFVAERHRMEDDLEALAYRLGGVIGRGAIAETPVIDIAPYLDLIPVANIHEAVRPFTIRARLRRHTGQDATQSIWRGILTQPDAYPVMEQWFARLAASPPSGDRVQDVIRAKPAGAGDRCTIGTVGGRLELPDVLLLPLGIQAPLLATLGPLHDLVGSFDLDVPLRIDVPEDFDSGLGPCSLVLPVTRTPRMVAGMPLTDDVIRCQRKPVDPSDYARNLNAGELDELRRIFPDGVCDWTKPAAHDVEKSMLWPSLGGEMLETPHSLEWRVARSS